ncbi:MAG: zinc-ribbon domain-containing protein [Deltaproteobacteria bacterium]|jgi:predicted Zn finger-like uncharacterized protein
MDVRCDKCGTEYEFDENRIGANGVTVKCTACGFVFKVRRPGRKLPPRASTAIGAGPQGREWLVRKPDGQMIAFRELTTLQKWIVEGRIGRDDEISKNGETWKRLGNIMELEPFFSVYEKAQTLNSMIEQGGSAPMQLRGSELLAAMNPLDPSSLAPGAQYTIPPRSAIVQADAPQPTVPVPVPAAPSAAIARQTIPPPSAAMHEPPTPAPDNGHVPTATLPPPPMPSRDLTPTPRAPSRDLAPTSAAIDRTAPVASTGLAGPGALDRAGPAPATFGSTALDIDIDDHDGPDPVAEFEQGRRRRKFFWVLLIAVFAGTGASVAYALYGPPNNPARKLAEQYGVLEMIGGDDGAQKLIAEAEMEADKDTVSAQKKRIALLEEAQRIRTQDPALVADRGLAVAFLAQTHAMRAFDLEQSAARAREAIETHQREVEAIKAKSRRGRADLPPEPQVPDPAALEADAKRERAEAERLQGAAEELVQTAVKADPEGFEVSRALAARHLIVSASGLAQAPLDRAKQLAQADGRTDAQTLYLESVLTAGDLKQVEATKLESAVRLAEQALTSRPTMNRARVWAARLHLLAQRPAEARKQLEKVLTSAPDHQAAKRVRALLPAPKKAAPTPAAAIEPKPEAAPPPPPPPPPAKAEEPEKDFDYWMARADRLRERDRTKAALNAYGRAAELRPNSAETHTGKGWCFLDMERPRLALTSFERAVRVNDRYAEAYYGLAESHRALKNTSEAIKAYTTYLARARPNSPERRAAKLTLERLQKSAQ